ncbi:MULTISPECIES: plasmid segregation protein ParM domain-containing protein [unclassified Lactococcus]|uniref:plasmid segregation protein ParM domain-containing protein n=1 Tax=unclassified Lactococcus TaxID=2643510 RepID=UPI0011CB947E|nr:MULTISPECIES: plasmid segregation protein ParM domain-containing protein [unclassified Lactococcus]MQW22008.1 hypothetical protein [Lactococcus sp. dk101]TXK36813.1 hypothetical protein FVP42_10575 [Lactococcus sp. dk310]TXK47490.1 hypothetical protein FVP43_10270 [Lactococcus sp. dk322]
MEFEEAIQRHEDKLKQHDKELQRLNDFNLTMQNHINETFIRVEESNKFLQTQNIRQAEQNEKILNAVLEQKEKNESRTYDLKKVSQENMWKMIFGIGGSAALIWAAIQQILKII